MKMHKAVFHIAGWLLHLNSPVYGKVMLHLPTISLFEASLHHMMEPKLEEIPIIREFLDVFPDDIPGRPPERAIEL
jgi:hypothetical protein